MQTFTGGAGLLWECSSSGLSSSMLFLSGHTSILEAGFVMKLLFITSHSVKIDSDALVYMLPQIMFCVSSLRFCFLYRHMYLRCIIHKS